MRELLPDVLTVADLALKFGQVERATYHQDGTRPETDTDHTVMLGLIACSLAERINAKSPETVGLRIGLIAQYALVHDLVEALAGDTDMLDPSPAKVADKEDRERKASAEIKRRTARLPWISNLIEAYDRQSLPEARFVRAVDKIMPKLTMALNRGAGVIERQDPSKVPELNRTQIDKLRATYAADLPEVVDLLEAACRQSEAILAGPKCEEEVVTGVDRGVITRKGPCGAPAKYKGDNDILLCARCAEHAFVASELPLPGDRIVSRLQLKREVWLATASQQARLSTCLRAQVGCVLLREDGSVAGTGYNGSLPGYAHCEPQTCNPSARCLRTRHAERSALDYSLGPINAAYVTHEPCLSCLKDLLARGCTEIYFLNRYPVKDPVEANAKRELLRQSRVTWTWLSANGQIIFCQYDAEEKAKLEELCALMYQGCDEGGFLPVPK